MSGHMRKEVFSQMLIYATVKKLSDQGGFTTTEFKRDRLSWKTWKMKKCT